MELECFLSVPRHGTKQRQVKWFGETELSSGCSLSRSLHMSIFVKPEVDLCLHDICLNAHMSHDAEHK